MKKIYIISNKNLFPDYVKIGKTSSDPTSRLRQYQTGDPLRQYKFEWIADCEYATEIESFVVESSEEYRNEWVYCLDIPSLISRIKNVADHLKVDLIEDDPNKYHLSSKGKQHSWTVRAGGNLYPSTRVAAEIYDVSPSTIQNWCRYDSHPDFEFVSIRDYMKESGLKL